MLLFASLVFYGWGEPIYILLMLFSAAVNYFSALHIKKKGWFVFNVAFNIGMLVVFKYTDFLIGSVNGLLSLQIPLTHLKLPIGISFYTFQTMSYVIDVYRGEIEPQKSFSKLLLYITFFPQLIAGPIVVYKDIALEIDDRTMDLDGFVTGMERFTLGFAKKLLIANQMAYITDGIYSLNEFSTLGAWIASITYIFQIYFDFSGYSDMAIGLGRIFGFHFKENFNYPYIAETIQDFWRRWHISLSSWFRDYLYIPLGGNRRGERIEYRNKIIVFFFTGLWHGAAWTFVLWGLWHGLFLLLEKAFLHPKKWWKPFRHVYTLLVVLIGFIIFRSETIGYAFEMTKNLFIYRPSSVLMLDAIMTRIDSYRIFIFGLAIFFSTPIYKRIRLGESSKLWLSFLLFLLCVLSLSATTYNPFIYFRF
ncbi:MBOAT family O-acyltransferase [Guggenheimella bovis]